MSNHLEAKMGDIADTVLMPGDPLRAKYIAENFLENPVCYNKVRNAFGYTGTYKGHRISDRGTGLANVQDLIAKQTNLFLETQIENRKLRQTLMITEEI